MELLKYIAGAAWREASKMARVIYIFSIAIPGSLTLIAGRTGWNWLDGLLREAPFHRIKHHSGSVRVDVFLFEPCLDFLHPVEMMVSVVFSRACELRHEFLARPFRISSPPANG